MGSCGRSKQKTSETNISTDLSSIAKILIWRERVRDFPGLQVGIAIWWKIAPFRILKSNTKLPEDIYCTML